MRLRLCPHLRHSLSACRRLSHAPHVLKTTSRSLHSVAPQAHSLYPSLWQPPVPSVSAARPFSTRTYNRQTAQAVQTSPVGLEGDEDQTANHGEDPPSSARDIPEDSNEVPRPPSGDSKSPDAWAYALDQLLPPSLRISAKVARTPSLTLQDSAELILKLLNRARGRKNANVDLLTYIGVEQSRWKAVIWLSECLIKRVSASTTTLRPDRVPSNIDWNRPGLEVSIPLDALCKHKVRVDSTLWENREPSSTWAVNRHDPRYADLMSTRKDATMTQLWFSLGSIVIDSADMPQEQQDEALNAIHRILGRIHSAGLMPEHIYSYNLLATSASAVQRPPYLKLLSARIMSTFSDAAWMAQWGAMVEETSVEKAFMHGHGQHEPPGRLMRSKMEPLGPEVWLEFILWCCVDGGFFQTASRLLRRIQNEKSSPWFAISWFPARGVTEAGGDVDWNHLTSEADRMNQLQPKDAFTQMPARTISAEVVLAIVEMALNSVVADGGSRGTAFAKVQPILKSTLEFLEPHSLPQSYFQYLSSRISQLDGFDVHDKPNELYSFTQTFDHLLSLESVIEQDEEMKISEIEQIKTKAMMYPALLQQCLDSCARVGDVRTAIEVYAAHQKFVDSSTLQTIASFFTSDLKLIQDSGEIYYQPPSDLYEYRSTHGQLPPLAVAGFLNMITYARLPRLGEWFVYNDEVDGPLLPFESYRLSCTGTALARFAAMSQDKHLIFQLERARRSTNLLPSVNFLRALCNAQITFENFPAAEKILQELRKAITGGFGPQNIASLGAVILRLEQRFALTRSEVDANLLADARSLLERVLAGDFAAKTSDHRTTSSSLFKQQISSLVRIFGTIPDTQLNEVAQTWRSAYQASNKLNLPPATFNILLDAVVDCKGSQEGRILWDLFCEDPRENDGSVEALSEDEDDLAFESDPEMRNRNSDLPFEAAVTQQDSEQVHKKESAPERDRIVEEPQQALTDTNEIQSPPAPISEGISFAADFEDNPSNTLWNINIDSDNSTSTPNSSFSSSSDRRRTALSTITTFPLVRPTLQTLRTIVRANLLEKRNQIEFSYPPGTQSVLHWAMQFFVAFQVPKETVELEVQFAVPKDEYQRLMLKEARTLYERTRRKSGLEGREGYAVSIAEQFGGRVKETGGGGGGGGRMREMLERKERERSG